ncbi:Ectoine hydrolase [wastewater metagenome]|uniref:Ectoine hydrolase n=2 Tax=unclassified sequences TaxID=12908 RepID=A0A5B8R7S1_9ZZZZ|nr:MULTISPECIES: Xaa-Pro peptidase family protein [Arhodomonas]MCS4503761.1 Xaa-Pro peptidase family protein [Arhodomonas aquaeolei]QEA04710.1 ectoine hydrolase [uncultured organism]
MQQASGRYFSDAEYERRRRLVRERMSEQGHDALLIASPENINYLSGLDHMGYFACQLLIFPAKGQPMLVTRAMEQAVVRDQVPDLIHIGYTDGSAPAADDPLSLTGAAGEITREPRRRPPLMSSAAVRETVRALNDAGLASGQIAVDQTSTFLPYAVLDGIIEGTPEANWEDIGSLIDDVRLVQSADELALTREAAAISDSMMLSAIATAGTGMNAREVMAAIYDAMFRRGGTYPGFVPLVRTTANLDHEHGTWEDRNLVHGDLLFLEMSGCVRRYHAPMGRLAFIGEQPAEAQRINEICQEAMMAAAGTIAPGVPAGDVYEAWQGVLDRNGLSHYHRHHCGYSVGIGYPPSWSGSGVPVGLRRNSDMKLREGMVFHLMSWLLGSGQGDAFLSDTITVTGTGCEFLTTVNRDACVR